MNRILQGSLVQSMGQGRGSILTLGWMLPNDMEKNMTLEIEDGGPAFPTRDKIGEEADFCGVWRDVFGDFGGMTLRDYFAAKAVQGILAHPDCKDIDQEIAMMAAKESFMVADAMLKARVA